MKSKKYRLSAVVFYTVIIALALVLPKMAFAAPVPDTGQTKCYNNTQEIPCPQPGEPFYGQDGNYTCNPHSYTDFGNGIVRDNVTGLEWQQATAPGTYTWQHAMDYCAGLTLDGKDDWRLPTVKELLELFDNSAAYPRPLGPTINKRYFPNAVEQNYWTSTKCAYSSPPGYYTNYAYYVGSNLGYFYFYGAVNPESMTSNFCVIAVRGAQQSNSFIDTGDGTITDNITGLMWQKDEAPGKYNWQQALYYCENLTLAGYADWRLPNINELQSIFDYSRDVPIIDTALFHVTRGAEYWSSTSGSRFAGAALSFTLGGNTLGDMSKASNFYYVRAVRGGQCEPPPTVIELASFAATPKAGQVIFAWSTASEIDNAGFNLYRAESENGQYTKINKLIITAQGSATQGASYEFADSNVQNRKTYYYKLEDIDLNGTATMQGPVNATPRWFFGIFGN